MQTAITAIADTTTTTTIATTFSTGATVHAAIGQALTLLEPQSRFGDKPPKFEVVCPQSRTAFLKGLTEAACTRFHGLL